MKNYNLSSVRKLLLRLALAFLISTTYSCTKLVEVDPPVTDMNSENVYSNDATAASVLTGLYTNIASENSSLYAGISTLSFYGSLSADELMLYDMNDLRYDSYWNNDLIASASGLQDYWNSIYPSIYVTNAAIEGVSSSNSLTTTVKQQLLGEAKFMRAFYYFYLVNLYGDVPLILTTDWKNNASLNRSSKIDVYKQIISDLKEAETLLSEKYLLSDAKTPYPLGSEERVRPTKWAALALLARTYLYSNDWINAETKASQVINNVSLFEIVGVNDVFVRNNKEAIWQLQSVGSGINANTGDAKLFILPETGPNIANPVYLSNNLMNSFEPGDFRKQNWINSVTADNIQYFYPFKYKVGAIDAPTSEYITVLRLAELYLIRSEAKAHQNKILESQQDLNIVRSRAGLSATTAIDQNSLLAAIDRERRVEFFTEWGHRWLDIKRRGTANDIMSQITPTKGGNWSKNDELYPIPQSELSKGVNLVQNPGYN